MPERTKKEEKRNFSTVGTEKERKERKTVDRWEIERRIERGGNGCFPPPLSGTIGFPLSLRNKANISALHRSCSLLFRFRREMNWRSVRFDFFCGGQYFFTLYCIGRKENMVHVHIVRYVQSLYFVERLEERLNTPFYRYCIQGFFGSHKFVEFCTLLLTTP